METGSDFVLLDYDYRTSASQAMDFGLALAPQHLSLLQKLASSERKSSESGFPPSQQVPGLLLPFKTAS